VDLVAVEPAAFARADRGAVAPRCVRVAVPLALGTALGEVALAVRVGGHVGAVDGDVLAHAGHQLVQPGGHAVEARGERGGVFAQPRGEAVARPLRGNRAERIPQRGVLGHEPDGAAPSRERVHALDESHPDHRADWVAGATRPARRLKLSHERLNLGRVEEGTKLGNRRARWYFGYVHGAITSVGLTRGGCCPARVTYSRFVRSNLHLPSDRKTAAQSGKTGFRLPPVPIDQGVFARGWADLKQATHHWWRFRIPAAVLTAGFAVWGALLPSKAGAGERAALAVGSTFGGALVLGTLAWLVLVVTASTRQRNEAWDRLGVTSSDPAALADEYADWLSRVRASLPDPPSVGIGSTAVLYDRELRAKHEVEQAGISARFQEKWSEAEVRAREQYHERFRERVLTVLGESPPPKASEPHGIQDFEAVEKMLARARRGIKAEEVAAFKDFTQRFVGWVKSHEIAAPPDMTEEFGADYGSEQLNKLESGEITLDEYQRLIRPLIERNEWVANLRSEYQRDWRADMFRWLNWAQESGQLRASFGLLFADNPHVDDFARLVDSLERIAGKL
jgi:hypothetical protein